jgi:acetolactate synthase small subunit
MWNLLVSISCQDLDRAINFASLLWEWEDKDNVKTREMFWAVVEHFMSEKYTSIFRKLTKLLSVIAILNNSNKKSPRRELCVLALLKAIDFQVKTIDECMKKSKCRFLFEPSRVSEQFDEANKYKDFTIDIPYEALQPEAAKTKGYIYNESLEIDNEIFKNPYRELAVQVLIKNNPAQKPKKPTPPTPDQPNKKVKIEDVKLKKNAPTAASNSVSKPTPVDSKDEIPEQSMSATDLLFQLLEQE